MKLQRYAGNPILSPHPDHAWKIWRCSTPPLTTTQEAAGAAAVRAAESHPEYKCYFGLATSSDGYHFERASDERC